MISLGAILAGGAASRYGGRAKGTERVGGRRIVDRVHAALVHAGARPIVLVSGRPAAAGWLPGVAVHPDVRAGCGSLGGVHAALSLADSCGADGVYVVAWDMPFVTAAALVQLRLSARDAMAAVPVHDDGTAEPLCGWYSRHCLPAAAALLDRGERRAAALAEHVGFAALPAGTFGDAERLFTNINTPDDLVRARRRDRGIPRAAALA